MVSFVDSTGIRHSVEVAAESLFEAAALAVHEFRSHSWLDDVEPGAATPLSISVKPPATTHEVSIKQLEKWTASTAPRALVNLCRSLAFENSSRWAERLVLPTRLGTFRANTTRR